MVGRPGLWLGERHVVPVGGVAVEHADQPRDRRLESVGLDIDEDWIATRERVIARRDDGLLNPCDRGIVDRGGNRPADPVEPGQFTGLGSCHVAWRLVAGPP
jgi:hypothetical protein